MKSGTLRSRLLRPKVRTHARNAIAWLSSHRNPPQLGHDLTFVRKSVHDSRNFLGKSHMPLPGRSTTIRHHNALDWELNNRFKIHSLPAKLRRQGWAEILRHWGRLINDFCYSEPTIETDVPYWYGERPLTGLLAAAAWQSKKGWSLEEFASIRGASGDTSCGRGDLWIGIGPASFTIEAKIVWVYGSPSQGAQDVRVMLAKAAEQLRSFDKRYSVGTHVALTYAVPSVPNGSEHVADDFFAALPATFKGGSWLVASYRHPKPPADPEDERGRVYPGVVLIGQTV